MQAEKLLIYGFGLNHLLTINKSFFDMQGRSKMSRLLQFRCWQVWKLWWNFIAKKDSIQDMWFDLETFYTYDKAVLQMER